MLSFQFLHIYLHSPSKKWDFVAPLGEILRESGEVILEGRLISFHEGDFVPIYVFVCQGGMMCLVMFPSCVKINFALCTALLPFTSPRHPFPFSFSLMYSPH